MPGATRTSRKCGRCLSFKGHSLSPLFQTLIAVVCVVRRRRLQSLSVFTAGNAIDMFSGALRVQVQLWIN